MHKFRHKSTRLCVGTHVFTKFSEITAITSFKVIQVADFGTNRKLIYDFLLVINTNLPPILHRFQVMANFSSNFR